MVFCFLFCFAVEGLFHLNFPNWDSCIISPHSFCLELPAVYMNIGPWFIHGIFFSQSWKLEGKKKKRILKYWSMTKKFSKNPW